jgi:uncharacterized protein (TIGR03083 family)
MALGSNQHLMSPSDACVAYLELHERVSLMLSREGEAEANQKVPHCPEWTVKDVLAHMVGVPEDILSGNLNGVTTAEWTQRQVDRHAEHTIPDLLQIWSETLRSFSVVLSKIPQTTLSQFIFDQVTHEHDIRHAIAKAGARSSSAIAVAEGFLRNSLTQSQESDIRKLSESSIRGFDFVRSLSGRRTISQIDAVGLSPDSVVAFVETTPFSVPTIEVTE